LGEDTPFQLANSYISLYCLAVNMKVHYNWYFLCSYLCMYWKRVGWHFLFLFMHSSGTCNWYLYPLHL